MEILFLVGRILYGGFFVMMGLNHFMKGEMMTQYALSKGVPSPKLAVYGSGLLILLGGLGVLLGIYTEIAIWLIIAFLFFVSFKMHNFWAIDDQQQKMAEMTNFMKNMALLGAALMFLIIFSWPFSVVGY